MNARPCNTGSCDGDGNERLPMFHRTIRMPASLWQAAADADYLNGLERVLYALRHLQHHVGELCAYQKAANLEPAQWK